MRSELLVVFPNHSPFVDQDIDQLRNRFTVDTLEYARKTDRFSLLAKLGRSQLAIAWFVLGYAYPMVLLRRAFKFKCVMIAGGWDVEALPDLGYGAMLSPLRQARTSYALSRADHVFAVSASTLRRVRHWAPAARAEILYHGFDGARFVPGNEAREGVLTVARIGRDTWRLKGLDTLVRAAQLMPDVQFTIAGRISPDEGNRELPPNVRAVGSIPQPELIRLYQRARIYVQLSAVESFGCSLAEAMLCGCIPVTTDRGALLEVTGSAGRVVPYGDAEATAQALREALDASDGQSARDRILQEFPIDRRVAKMAKVLETLLEA